MRFGIIPSDDIWRFLEDPRNLKPEEREESDLHQLFFAHDGLQIMKWKKYLSVYNRHLARYRNKPVRILEIGVFKGGSLDLWRKYFGPAATIFGVDIDPQCAAFSGRSGQIRIGSQDDPVFLQTTVSEMGGVDVVIDDGSHRARHQRASFDALFPLLSDGGTYICEDLHTAYWPTFSGGYHRRGTFIEYAKQIIDDMHSDFHVKKPIVSNANRSIDSINFYNSIVVIEKKQQLRPSHFVVGASQ